MGRRIIIGGSKGNKAYWKRVAINQVRGKSRDEARIEVIHDVDRAWNGVYFALCTADAAELPDEMRQDLQDMLVKLEGFASLKPK